MSEIVYDSKFGNVELSNSLGLTLSATAPRIKHTGSGTLAISSAGPMTIESSDTTSGITMGATTSVPVTVGSGGGALTLGASGATATFGGDVIVTGDLTVSGDTVSHDVVTIQTEDPVMRLNEGSTGSNAVDIGFVGDRGDDTNIGFFWDESADQFACVFLTNDDQLSLTGSPQNTGINDYADLRLGALTVDDAATVGSTLGVTGNFSVNTNKFTVTASSGDTVVAGTLDVTGNASFSANVSLGDSDNLYVGAGNDLTVVHNGTNTSATNATGTFTIASTVNTANALYLHANGGTSETIQIRADQGTAATSINIVSDAGGITLNANGTTAVTNAATVGGTLGVTGAVTVGSDGSGADVTFYSATAGDSLLWDASEEKLVITGTDGQNALEVPDGNVNFTDNLTVGGTSALTGAVTVGSDGSGADVTFYSATAGDSLLWDASEEKLVITGTDGQNALEVPDGNVNFTDNLSVGGTLGVTGVVTASSNVDIEGYAAVGNGSALSADSGLIVDYDATYTGVGQQVLVKGTVTGAANTNAYGVSIQPESITVPAGTTTTVASLHLKEPAVTATGTLTNSATLYIESAATEATNDYALWVDDGAVKFDGTLAVDSTSTLTGDVTFGGNIVADADEAKAIFAAVTSNTITIGATGSTTAIAGAGTVGGALTVGTDGAGFDVTFHSATASDSLLWDASEEKLVITGTDGQNALEVPDGNVNFTDNLSVGGTLGVTGVVTASSNVDIEGYAAVGNGSALSADSGLLIDYDATYTGVGQQLLVKGTVTGAANTNAYGVSIQPEGITVPAGTTSVVASLHLKEPAVTATGTLTNSATLYIESAATEATNDYALWVDAGATKLDGTLAVDGVVTTTSNVDIEGYAAVGNGSALSADSGLLIDYDATYTGVGQQLLVKGTVTGAANTNAYGVSIQPEGITVPAGTTTTVASLHLKEPAVTATGTLTNSATLYIENAASEATNDYAIWVDDGAVKFDSTLEVVGVTTLSNDVTLRTGDAITLTHTSDAASEDLTIAQAGANDSSLLLTSAGTGTDAIGLTTTAGGIDINAFNGLDLQINGTSQLDLSADGTLTLKANETYTITHASNGDGDDLTISQTGANDASLLLTSAGTGTDAIGLTTTAGGIDVNAFNGLDLQINSVSQVDLSADGTMTLKANETYTITHASDGAGDDLTISQTGANDASLLLTSAGTGADAIGLTSSAGGITLSASTGSTAGMTFTNTAATDFTSTLVTGAMGHKAVTTDYNVTDGTTNGKTTVYVDWRLGNVAQVSALISLSGIINTNGTDNDVVGYAGAGSAGEILLLPSGTKILHISANVVELSNATADMYSVFAHSASVNEDAGAGGTELINGIEADSGGSTGVKVPTTVNAHGQLLRYIFLANDGSNTTSGSTARTAGKILLTMVVSLAQ